MNEYMKMDEYFIEHIKFRRFTTKKLLEILSNEKFKNTRIIICGDHGFRGTSKNAQEINPNLTTLYTKGFNHNDIDSINYVQDLSYLILNSF